MENLQKILGDISPGMSMQTLLRITQLVFQLVVMHDMETLTLLFRRLETVQRNAETPDTIQTGVNVLLAGIERGLQDIERMVWIEHLTRTVNEDVGRRSILRTLKRAGCTLSESEICKRLHETSEGTDQPPEQTIPTLGLLWAFIAPTLEAFELQQVVQKVQVEGREPNYQLTNLGFDLCAHCHIG